MSTNAAITGVGCVSPYGVGSSALWCSTLANSPGPRTLRKRLDGTSGFAMESPSSEVLTNGTRPVGVLRPARSSMLARVAAEEAWTAASVATTVDPERAGIVVNRNFAQHHVIGQYYETLWKKGPGAVSGLQFVQTIANSALGSLALHFRLRGPSTMLFGPPSLCIALDLLRDDAGDAFLVGGFDELSDYIFELCHLCSLSFPPEEVGGQPYNAASRGLIPGEGSAFFTLEKPEHAISRGVKPLAYLKGYGSVTDKLAVRNPAERDSRDISEAIRRALCDAKLRPEDVSFVSGAANGLPAIDQSELEAIGHVFPQKPSIFSVKGGVGETWGAAAGMSTLAAVHALSCGLVPPNTGSVDRPALVRSGIVTGVPIPRRPGAALVISMEMSGQNTALLVSDEP